MIMCSTELLFVHDAMIYTRQCSWRSGFTSSRPSVRTPPLVSISPERGFRRCAARLTAPTISFPVSFLREGHWSSTSSLSISVPGRALVERVSIGTGRSSHAGPPGETVHCCRGIRSETSHWTLITCFLKEVPSIVNPCRRSFARFCRSSFDSRT